MQSHVHGFAKIQNSAGIDESIKGILRKQDPTVAASLFGYQLI